MTHQERLAKECVKLFVKGLDAPQIATALNATEQTVYKIFQHPVFLAELKALGYELDDRIEIKKMPKHTLMPKFFWIAFSFKGRINRRTFWLMGLTNWIFLGIFIGLASLVYLAEPSVLIIWFLISTWSGLAVCTKRLYDCNMSGWWQLFGLIPVIGGIWGIVQYGFLKGTDGPNRFGPKP